MDLRNILKLHLWLTCSKEKVKHPKHLEKNGCKPIVHSNPRMLDNFKKAINLNDMVDSMNLYSFSIPCEECPRVAMSTLAK